MTLTDDITTDLESRIRARGPAPIKLTLAALTAEYSVSTTPIRQALTRLVTIGLVQRLPNGRLTANPRLRRGVARKRSRPLAPQSTPVAETIEREILHRSLRGEHDFLREEAFAEHIGIGRTKLRRVLHELAGAGVVEHVERCGWRARPFQESDMIAFLQVRATLELQALDLAKAQLVHEDLAGFLRGNNHDAIAAGHIDNGLHEYFVAKADNHYLAAFFASHGRYYSRLFDFAAVGSDRLEEMAGQHTEILEHAQARRWARARTALRHHIQSQAPVLSAAIEHLKQQCQPTL